MYCMHCGMQIPDNAKFCPECGKNPKTSSTQTSNNTQTDPQYYATNGTVEPQYVGDAPFVNQVYNDGKANYPGMPPKKKGKGCLVVAIISLIFLIMVPIIFIIATFAFADSVTDGILDDDYYYDDTYTSDSSSDASVFVGTDLELDDVRDMYTTIYDDGSDEFTLMIYMIGSDLESDAGYASDDIEEMLNAEIGDNVNVVLMTGGASSWSNPNIDSDTCQYWEIVDGKLSSIDSDVGDISMTDENTLSAFIRDSAELFPTNRYGLILWDHGGGTLCGFGYDENFPDDYLTLEETATAFSDSGVLFDFVGYDACLMGTVEMAIALEPYSDYLIASEELEEASGWYYTEWLTALGQDPSIATLDLGTILIDSFIDSHVLWQSGTLSITELRQMPYAYQTLCTYFVGASTALANNSYSEISTARNNSKAFGESDYDQVDAIDFILKSDLDGADETIEALNNAIKYSSSTSNIEGAYGLSMYFPYDYPEDYSAIQSDMESVGYTSEYLNFFSEFVSIMTGGQMYNNENSGSSSHQEETHDYSEEDWYDPEIAESYEDNYQMNNYDELVIELKNGSYVLELSDSQWEEITLIELQVLLDDGTGYQFLGSDNVYEFNHQGDLLVEFDYTWVALDGNIVPFYAEVEVYNNDNDWYTYGTVPAILNDGDMIEVVVYWDDANPYGYVAGYRKYTDSPTASAKGLFELQTGDQLEWVFDYYTYDFEYDDSYIVGDPYTVDSDIEVSYEYVEDYDSVVYFQLTDIYNNVYVTEAVIYTD